MAKITFVVLTAAAALVFTGCAGTAPENCASAAEQTLLAASTKDAIVKLENSAYEAWKSKDAKFWDTFLSDKFAGYGSAGKLDKVSAMKEYAGVDCEIKTYALSDEKIKALDNDAALMTHQTTVNGTCGGQMVPAKSWAAGVYVRDGDKWKGAFHAEALKKLEELTATDISFINIFGTYFGTKADALKDWAASGCDVKSVSLTDAAGAMLTPTVAIPDV